MRTNKNPLTSSPVAGQPAIYFPPRFNLAIVIATYGRKPDGLLALGAGELNHPGEPAFRLELACLAVLLSARMANKYYQPGKLRGEKVDDLFATIAPRYDLINDLQSLGLHRLWKRHLVRLAACAPGQRALDLCSGTGDVAFALAGTGVAVVALDFSEAMLGVAKARAGAGSRNGVNQCGRVEKSTPQFIRGDAQALPFPDESFDLVTVSYGLRNLSSWELGLGEMWRVAKRGGRLLVLDFGKPDHAIWRALYFAYLRSFVPLFGKVFCGDAQTHSYIFESLRQYPAQHGVAAKMRELGCRDVRILPLLGGVMTINSGVKP